MALRKAFKYFDADASGDIDPDEFFAAMHAFGLEFTEDQVLALFGYYDVDRDGGLSYYEFIEKVMDSGFGNETDKGEIVSVAMGHKEEADTPMKSCLSAGDLNLERAKHLFRKFDANNSGEIDMRELGLVVKSLGLNMGAEEINNAMIDLDKDSNGSISFQEFWDWFQTVSVVRVGSSQTPMKSAMASANLKNKLHAKLDEAGMKSSEDQDAQVASINRPQTAGSGRSKSKIGSWVSRSLESALEGRGDSPVGRIRPQTAMERSSGGSGGPAKRWGSAGWRSVSRCDFRPPSGKVMPPRLNLPSGRRSRPMSAQPLIREPGEADGPLGSTSGFRL